MEYGAPMSSFKVVSMPAPHCGHCSFGIKLEPVTTAPLEGHKHIVGHCPNAKCPRYEIKLEVPLTATRCLTVRNETNNSH